MLPFWVKATFSTITEVDHRSACEFRCYQFIFCLNDWIEFIPDSDIQQGMNKKNTLFMFWHTMSRSSDIKNKQNCMRNWLQTSIKRSVSTYMLSWHSIFIHEVEQCSLLRASGLCLREWLTQKHGSSVYTPNPWELGGRKSPQALHEFLPYHNSLKCKVWAHQWCWVVFRPYFNCSSENKVLR